MTGYKSQSQSGESLPPPSSQPTSSGYAEPAPFSAPITAPDVSSFISSASIPDASKLHPLSGLNEQTLEYISLDEGALSTAPGSKTFLPSRGWSDDLCYGTGTTYLAALGIGGAWGMVEGLNKMPPSAPPKLRLNGVLNSITRRGPFLGNSAGVIAMTYNGVNSLIGYYRGKHDTANSIVAGALSGMIFKSTRGVKPMMVSGGLVASVAGAWAVSYLAREMRTLLIVYRSFAKLSQTNLPFECHSRRPFDFAP